MILTSLLKKATPFGEQKLAFIKHIHHIRVNLGKKNDIKGQNSMMEKELSSKRKT